MRRSEPSRGQINPYEGDLSQWYLPRMRLGKFTLIVLAALFAVFAFGSATAGAETDGTTADLGGAYVGNEPPPEVLGNSLTPQAPAQVAGAAIERPAAQGAALAFTGGDTMAIALAGGATLLAGVVLVAARRRTTTA